MGGLKEGGSSFENIPKAFPNPNATEKKYDFIFTDNGQHVQKADYHFTQALKNNNDMNRRRAIRRVPDNFPNFGPMNKDKDAEAIKQSVRAMFLFNGPPHPEEHKKLKDVEGSKWWLNHLGDKFGDPYFPKDS